ncbi:YhdP family protein [Shewanella atlantica]|uniref:YhdP family protein n=1 Tax=Shewanella atlantica TaxID=271099 RepID=UPI0037368827
MPRQFCPRKFSRYCWQTLAVILVLFALAVSLFRGLLPQLTEVRQDLVNYIEDEYQVQVSVGELNAEWQAFGPALTVKELVLPPQERLPFTLVIRGVHVKLDFWESLMTTSPQIENVIFEGVEVGLDLDKLNQVESRTNSAEIDTDWLYSLLLEQLEHFSISEGSLQLLSKHHDFSPIYVKDLRWQNSSGKHQGQGKLYLDEKASEVEQLSLSLQVNGSGFRPDNLTGQIYLAASSLDLGEWASRQKNPYDNKSKLPLEGVVNLQAWLSLSERSIESGLIQFEPSWLEWQLSGQEQHFEIKGGQLEWLPTESGWQLSSRNLEFETNERPWPELNFIAEQRGSRLSAYLNRLDTSSLLPLLPLVPAVDLHLLKTWQSVAPQGYLDNIKLSVDDERQPQLSVDVAQLQWQRFDGIPGSSPLDLKVAWYDDALYFSAPQQDYTLDFGAAFKAPITLSGAAFDAKFNTETSELTLPHLKLANKDIGLDASMKMGFAGNTHLALLADVKISDVANAGNYFPLQGMDAELVEYLEAGLVAGNTQDARVVWHGFLNRYPYKDHSGIFQAAFTLSDAEFEFQPDWPPVRSLELSALFENAAMYLTIDNGDLLDVVVDGARINIPELGARSLLEIDAELATKGAAATEVIQASPLADSVGSTLEVVQIQGDVTASLDLSIPLYDGEEEQIRGRVNFDQTPVYISEPGVQLDGVTGQVSFVNEVVKGKDIKALLYQQPVSLSFDTEQVRDNYGLNLDLNGVWQLDALPPELDNPLMEFYSGEVSWDGAMTLIFDQTGYRIQAQVNSDLLGTELMLPAPFTKAAGEKRRLSAELIGDNKQSSIGIKLGKQMEFWGGFDIESGDQLHHFDLLLGRLFKPGDQLKRDNGHLQLDIAQTEFSPWLPVITSFIASGETGGETEAGAGVESDSQLEGEQARGFFPPLVSIDAQIADLNLMGQQLSELTIAAKPNEQAWRFEAMSNEFDGRIDFYPDWSTQGLKMVASKFYIAPSLKEESQADFKSDTVLNNLPPLALDVDDFRLYGKPLGHLVLQGTPQEGHYQIQTLSLTTPDVKLSGTGAWKNSAGENLTEFNVKLEATKFDAISSILDMDPGLKDAPVELDATISWQGAPYAFSLESLNGNINFELGKGHLSEVSDKGARIFSLFSLDSLLRKLSLDFSDVFGKGLYFNSFTGTLKIDNGVIKTRDTEMDAVAGNMKVRGYTDLVTESLNYDIRFVPQLASSVPTVVLLTTGGWTLGIGAFALTKVLEPVIEVITELRFRLTGTMSEPKLEELERKSKEIEIPESALPRKGEEQADKQPADSSPVKQQGVETPESEIRKPEPEQPLNGGEQEGEEEKQQSGAPVKMTESGVEILAPRVIEVPDFKEAQAPFPPASNEGREDKSESRIEREAIDADQSVTVPKQSRRSAKPTVYRVAA